MLVKSKNEEKYFNFFSILFGQGLTATKYVESCLISGPVKIYPLWVRHRKEIARIREANNNPYLSQPTIATSVPISRKFKPEKSSKDKNQMLASVKSALKTPKAFAKKKKSKGQKQDDLVFSSSDWDTPTPPARASFTSTYTTREIIVYSFLWNRENVIFIVHSDTKVKILVFLFTEIYKLNWQKCCILFLPMKLPST